MFNKKSCVSSKDTPPDEYAAKYKPIKKKSDHEILLDEFYNNTNNQLQFAKAFDFTSINDYSSIFKYRSSHALRRDHEVSLNDPRPLSSSEKLINYGIIGLFYFLLLILLPFSLLVCLKKVKPNEKMVVYRLGRIIKPAYEPGYCIVFPFVDSIQRHVIVQKEFSLPNLQILNHENAIIEMSSIVRYQVSDVIKASNTVQDLNVTLRSIARGILVSIVSKKDASKVEVEINYIKEDFRRQMNETIRKWGVEMTNIDMTVNSIVKDESAESNTDPALKSITQVFKSLFNSSSSSKSDENAPGTSASKEKEATAMPQNPFAQLALPPELMQMFQEMTPLTIPIDPAAAAGLAKPVWPAAAEFMPTGAGGAPGGEMSPYKVLKLLEPLINETLVKEIQTVYEFHIRSTADKYEEKIEVYHLDLKNVPKGLIGIGSSMFSKADCIIKLNDEDLNELLTDKLKPFTAYMNGRIEIEGDLQDVFKLKKLINSVTSLIKK